MHKLIWESKTNLHQIFYAENPHRMQTRVVTNKFEFIFNTRLFFDEHKMKIMCFIINDDNKWWISIFNKYQAKIFDEHSNLIILSKKSTIWKKNFEIYCHYELFAQRMFILSNSCTSFEMYNKSNEKFKIKWKKIWI